MDKTLYFTKYCKIITFSFQELSVLTKAICDKKCDDEFQIHRKIQTLFAER